MKRGSGGAEEMTQAEALARAVQLWPDDGALAVEPLPGCPVESGGRPHLLDAKGHATCPRRARPGRRRAVSGFPPGAFTSPTVRRLWPCAAVAATALLAATVWAKQHREPVEIAGHPRVVDGDTLAFGREHVRLSGIDAPESGQTCASAAGEPYPCGSLATRAMLKLVDGERVICRGDSRDRYGRLLATCWRGDLDVGREMVRDGQAIAYRHFSMTYAADEDEARAAHRGIWQGTFEEPYRWRQAHPRD